ncbi:MAG TPA: protein kinase [Pyrinomonadaceae bacterium]|nr:protein kinase [Pyrinomonadaceae bacterium]
MIGQTISHYRILEKLGEGGMGVVYVAEDAKLNRRVAIKFLSASQNHDSRARFLREARAISAVKHPNIATIHDYGETDEGQPYIIMELVEGETLGDLLHASALTLSRAVEIIEAVTAALGAAHARGIVHRDIKPANILIEHGGEVKVLDFGLAKLITDEQTVAGDPDALTLLAGRTHSGVILGTPLYLSPEQAMSQPVDARSDIFALGALLYECIAGRPAFLGLGIGDISAKILRDDPPKPSNINPRVPAALDRVVLKALKKKPEERYQTAEELLADLQAARASLSKSGEMLTQRMGSLPKPLHSSTLQTLSESFSRPRVSLAVVLLVVAIVGVALWLVLRWFQDTTTPPFQNMQITKLTSSGKSIDAVISPNGKDVVHVMDDEGRRGLWLRQVNTETASDIEIVPPAEVRYDGLTFSPDGDSIYFVRAEKGNDIAALYKMSRTGGAARKLLENIGSPVAFSTDGRMIAFIRENAAQGETTLMIANADGSGLRELSRHKTPDFFNPVGPSWSPDGKAIACSVGSPVGGFHAKVVEVSVADGAQSDITRPDWFYVDRVAWLANGRGLIITAEDQPIAPYQLWYVAYPGGQVRRITNDLNSYIGVSLSADSNSLVTIESETLSNIWIAPEADARRATRISSGSSEHHGVAWTPDGKIVYASVASGNPDIWVMNPDGSNRKQLTVDGGVDRRPAVSPDGRYIFFSSNRTGKFNIWRMDADGGNLKQLTNGDDEQYPSCSPDGQWVVYQGFVSGVPKLWKVRADGGESVQLTDSYSNWPVVSPDGRRIAFGYREKPDAPWKHAVVGFAGGAPERVFDIPMLSIPTLFWQRVQWSPDGSQITYINNSGGVSDIWSQSQDGAPPKRLTDFKSDQIFDFAWSRDGKQLACVRGSVTTDVILIKAFK